MATKSEDCSGDLESEVGAQLRLSGGDKQTQRHTRDSAVKPRTASPLVGRGRQSAKDSQNIQVLLFQARNSYLHY